MGHKASRLRWVERGALAVIALASMVWTGWWWAQTLPGAVLVTRSATALAVVYERALARAPVIERIEARLEESPRDWVVIGALVDLAAEQGVELPEDLRARIAALDGEDNGWIASGMACAACAWDISACGLGADLACGVAVNLTVLGDLTALVREGGAYLAGAEVDTVDVGIAVVGLAATGLVVVSGGTSMGVKAGAVLLRVAHRTGRLAPEVLRPLRHALANGIDWARLPAARSADDLAGLARPAVLRPAVALAEDLGTLGARLGPRQALRLTGAMDTPAEVARAARAAEVLGPRTLGAFEVLGKSRFLRLGLRLADEVWAALAGLVAALSSLAALAAPLAARLSRGILRVALRRALR